MTPGKKQAFEPTGLIPRSIVRTFERFYKQLLPRTKYSAIREYRISRYQVLVSLRCLCTLLILPLVTRIIANWLIFPQVQYFWDVTYQDSHVFSEIDQFSQVIFFDSLLDQGSLFGDGLPSMRSTTTERRREARQISTNVEGINDNDDNQVVTKNQDLSSLRSNHLRLLLGGGEADGTNEVASLLRQTKGRAKLVGGEAHLYLRSNGVYGTSALPITSSSYVPRSPTKSIYNPLHSDIRFLSGRPQVREAKSFANFEFQENFQTRAPLLSSVRTTNLHSNYVTSFYVPNEVAPLLRQTEGSRSPRASGLTSFARRNIGAKTNFLFSISETVARPKAFHCNNDSILLAENLGHNKSSICPSKVVLLENKTLNTFDRDQALQEKIFELAQSSHFHALQSLTNVFSDFLSIVVLIFLLITLRPEITILKSFLVEVIYNLSDTTKSFLLILMTDLLVGFHSPRGWETMFSLILHHFGLPENQDFVFLFVATLPVILDTVFKYWIFRHLNKISPSTVATYHNMIE